MVETLPTPNTYPDLFWGYTAIWTIIVLYILYLGRRLSKVERERSCKQ